MASSSMKETESNKLVLEAIVELLEKIINPISQYMKVIANIVLALMILPIVLNIVLRKFFNSSVPGAVEMSELALVVVVFFAIPFIQSRREHISIDLIVKHFPLWLQNVLTGFTNFLSLGLFILMGWRLYEQALTKSGVVSFMLGIPISIFIGLAFFGVTILSVVLLIDCLKDAAVIIKDGKKSWLIVILLAAIGVMISPFAIKIYLGGLSGLSLGLLGMLLLFTLMFLRMPIGYAMGLIGFIGLIIIRPNLNAPLSLLGIAPYETIANYVLTVAPMFILMGFLAFVSGISSDLFNTANKWLGRLPGGLAISSVAGCAGFSAVSGDSMSTAITMGTVALPEMKKKNYSSALSTGCVAAGGTLGILIPPSMGFIWYAIVTEQSIGKLFMAGLIPGMLMVLMFCLVIYIIAKVKPSMAPRGEAYSIGEKIKSLGGIKGMLFLFVLVLGGIMSGFFSPTEGGAVGAFGAFIYALAQRRLNMKQFFNALDKTVETSGKILSILIGVGILGYFLAATRLPMALAEVIIGMDVNRYLVLGSIIAMYMLLGCVLAVIPMILLTLPAVFPTVLALGFDPIWFGVVIVIVMEIGQITPPIGVNVFAIKSIAKEVPLEEIFKGIVPFFFCMLLCVILITVFPQIVMYLPNLMF